MRAGERIFGLFMYYLLARWRIARGFVRKFCKVRSLFLKHFSSSSSEYIFIHLRSLCVMKYSLLQYRYMLYELPFILIFSPNT